MALIATQPATTTETAAVSTSMVPTSEDAAMSTSIASRVSIHVDSIATQVIIPSTPAAHDNNVPNHIISQSVIKPITKVKCASTVFTHKGELAVPPHCKSDAFKSYLDLPVNDLHCGRVDMKNGLWYFCTLCNLEVSGHTSRAWNIGRWNEHIKKGTSHDKKKESIDKISKIREKKTSGKVCE